MCQSTAMAAMALCFSSIGTSFHSLRGQQPCAYLQHEADLLSGSAGAPRLSKCPGGAIPGIGCGEKFSGAVRGCGGSDPWEMG